MICKFGVPKYIITDNESKWLAEFDELCKNYGIIHQYTPHQWAKCNGMVEQLLNTLKHGFIVLLATPKHARDWDKQLPNYNLIWLQAWSLIKHQIVSTHGVDWLYAQVEG